MVQKTDSDSAIVMENATLYWTEPDGNNTENGLAGDKMDEDGKNDILPVLKNISFTLPKVLLRAFLLL